MEQSVVERYGERALMEAARKVLDEEFSCNPRPAGFRESIESALEGLYSEADGGFSTLPECIEESLRAKAAARQEGVSTKIPTGYRELDGYTGGFRPGQLVLLGGRTSHGKTVLATNIAYEVATQGKTVWFASLEMTKTEIADRQVSAVTGIPFRAFIDGDIDENCEEYIRSHDWPKGFRLTQEMHETPSSIRAKAGLAKPDLIVVDHLGLVDPPDTRIARHQQLKAITRELKRVAKERECIILVTCQLNVEADKRGADDILVEPMIRHFSEGKQIAEDADIVLMIWRKSDTNTEIFIRKCRACPTDVSFDLTFDGAHQRFVQPELVPMPM